MSSLAVSDQHRAAAATAKVIQPAWVRIVHWINAVAIVLMIMSGWQIYNASPLFGFSFPRRSPSAAGSAARCSGISPRCGC